MLSRYDPSRIQPLQGDLEETQSEMRVVLAACGTNHYYGLPKYFYFLAKHLTANGIEVEFIGDSLRVYEHLHEVLNSRFFPKIMPQVMAIGPMCQERFSFAATAIWCWKVAQYLHNANFDVLHCGHVTPYFYLKQRSRRPVVFQPFGNELISFEKVYSGPARLYYKVSQSVLRYCGEKADVLLAEADWQLDEMKKFYNRNDAIVLPVGIDIDYIRRKAKTGKLRRHNLDIDEDTFVLLTVNTFHPHKDYVNLIRALAILKEKIPKLVSIMVGVGPQWELCNALVRNLGLEENVRFLRNVPEDDLYGLYEEADCYVSPTKVTDFQMGIMEAEAFGLPIVSTAQQFMINGNGFVVGMNNASNLAFGIKSVYNVPALRELWSERSREIVKQWDFKNIAKEAIKIYERTA